jgi:tRNA(fMet)-specific endonuclease VapC
LRLAYLVDTDWAVWWMRGRSEVVARLTAMERDGLAISIITLAELYEGIESTRDPEAARPVLNDFLKLVAVIPFSEKVAARFGTEAAKLRHLGQPLPDFDLVIAVTALQHGLTLLTEDRHFERIPSLVIQSLSATGL